ncbi:hypothetical protein SLEP1_g50086 [Rubroshorea leprosula]|uniref:Uncharacterized protein n=1 Tax=Rubroshorea leprosula TaxID=152421 RepID=A0AAV5LZS4_9ROSI|nr:hypothetical protein SLEP1_g50086 [Rubroshorea leprosula]
MSSFLAGTTISSSLPSPQFSPSNLLLRLSLLIPLFKFPLSRKFESRAPSRLLLIFLF